MLRLAIALGLGLLFSVPVWAADEDDDDTIYGYKTSELTFDVFTLRYPAGRWDVEKSKNGENQTTFKLTSRSDSQIVLHVVFTLGLPSDDKEYENNPHSVNVAAALPAALKLADNDESKIITSVGVANLPESADTSCRATVLLDGKNCANVEACHFTVQDDDQMKLALALLLTNSVRGQINDSSEYANLIGEAYAIIQAIEYEGQEESEE